MALLNDEINEIKVQSRAERQALFEPVSELSRRVQPRHLVEVATQFAKHKVAGVVGGVSNAIKENGGTTAAVALGAVAVFDAGRRSAHDPTSIVGPADMAPETFSGGENVDAAFIRQPSPPRKVTNFDRAKVLAGTAGGLLVGHVIGRAFQPTVTERALFGKAADEVQDATDKFLNHHSHGAKVAAAQAFGVARYAAAFLTVMAALSDHMRRPTAVANKPTDIK
ncbi:hypothetical protein NKI94_26175 [Mesorhizobium australicum]|uniref:hypothetical protein n=1 Tax=Mesorhizobium australicum TaxID=536018 RepID=UPI00333DF298